MSIGTLVGAVLLVTGMLMVVGSVINNGEQLFISIVGLALFGFGQIILTHEEEEQDL